MIKMPEPRIEKPAILNLFVQSRKANIVVQNEEGRTFVLPCTIGEQEFDAIVGKGFRFKDRKPGVNQAILDLHNPNLKQ
jgi:hypothetical protein